MQQYTKYAPGSCKDSDLTRVLVACEYSRVLSNMFDESRFYVVSCDILDPDTSGVHYKGDVLDILNDEWDLVIAHPPCDFLSVSGNRWLYHPDDEHLPKEAKRDHPLHPRRREKAKAAADFAKTLYNCCAPYVAIENPVSRLSSLWRKSDQTIQPWMFGDDAEKATCYWLKGLPKLQPTKIITPTKHTTKSGKTYSKWWWDTCMIPTKNGQRAHARNKSFPGVSSAIYQQWGSFVEKRVGRV